MDARPSFVRRARRPLIALGTVVASFACAAAACLPSIDFESGGSNDSGLDGDGPSIDGTQPMADGGVDAPSNDATDGGPSDSSTDVAAPRVPMALSQFFGYGGTAACVMREGTLYCWGDPGANMVGQLGFPDEDAGGTVGILNPTAVPTPLAASQIVQIVMGEYHTCALYGSNTYCWGTDAVGQIGNATDGDGGPTEFAVVGLPARGLDSLAVSLLTTCGVAPIQDAGNVSNVYCWGYNGEGELGRSVDQGGSQTAVPVTGNIDGGPLGVIPNAVMIAGGGGHFCALTSTSKIFCWGGTQYFECGPGEGGMDCPGGNTPTCTVQPLEVTLAANETPVAIALGEIHSCALTKLGNVYCWGSNDSNQLGSANAPLNCTHGGMDAGCSATPIRVPVTGIQQLFAAGYASCAIDATRHVFCWGDNLFGELGAGNNNGNAYTTPQPLLDPVTGNPFTFDDMAMGRYSECARDGTNFYCWGSGVLGTQTDAGPTPNPYAPGLVQF